MKWQGFGSDNDLREAAGSNLPVGTNTILWQPRFKQSISWV